MKPALPQPRGLLSSLPPLFPMLSLGIATLGLNGQASAIAVDSELVLLVDVTQSGLNKKDFGSLMDSYASSFTSSEVLRSIQSGTFGRIAVSMMFYGNSSVQEVGIPWMSIGNATEAAQFAALASNISKPFSNGSADIASALTAATLSFGKETGGLSNGFESNVQIIDVAAASTPGGSGQAARDAALQSGVDLINAIALGNKATAIASYFSTDVIGSTLSGVAATSTTSPVNTLLTAALTTEITGSVSMGASAVPEPHTALALMTGLGFMLILRRRS
ncbi:MAG: DUF1194 domain-containing protein [Luteolibacter sp.]|uniref:DUF1194 domain-containing protein n=1 Tax=Luteolibacter sp. TaxID=1962973 RepID=UPI0032676E8C